MLGLSYIFLACLCWALDTLFRYPLIQAGHSGLGIVFVEHALLTTVFAYFLFKNWRKIASSRITDFFSFFMVGAIGSAFATVAFTKAFQHLDPSLVILLQKLQPLVVVSLARLLLAEKLQAKFFLWGALSLLGAILVSSSKVILALVSGKLEISNYLSSGSFLGYALVGIAILGWGSATVFGKKLTLAGYQEKEIMAGRFALGFLVLLPLINWQRSLGSLAGYDYLMIIAMVSLSAFLGMYLYYKGLMKVSARMAAIAELFFPVCAVTVNWIFLGQALDWIQICGAALLILGSTVIQLKRY